MNRQEFIERFIEENGYLPDEDAMQEVFPTALGGRGPAQISYLSSNRQVRARGEDLLGEVKGIFDDIASYARTSAKKKHRSLLGASPLTSELGYMFLVFVAKTSLYFILQSSYRDGFEYSNI